MPTNDDPEETEEMVPVITRLPVSLRDQLKEISSGEERSLAATIRMLCSRYVAEKKGT